PRAARDLPRRRREAAAARTSRAPDRRRETGFHFLTSCESFGFILGPGLNPKNAYDVGAHQVDDAVGKRAARGSPLTDRCQVQNARPDKREVVVSNRISPFIEVLQVFHASQVATILGLEVIPESHAEHSEVATDVADIGIAMVELASAREAGQNN